VRDLRSKPWLLLMFGCLFYFNVDDRTMFVFSNMAWWEVVMFNDNSEEVQK